MLNSIGLQNPGRRGVLRARTCAGSPRSDVPGHRQRERAHASTSTSRSSSGSRREPGVAALRGQHLVPERGRGRDGVRHRLRVGRGGHARVPRGHEQAAHREADARTSPTSSTIARCGRGRGRRRGRAHQHAARHGDRRRDAAAEARARRGRPVRARRSSRWRCAWCGRSRSAVDDPGHRHGRHHGRRRRGRVHARGRDRGGRGHRELRRPDRDDAGRRRPRASTAPRTGWRGSAISSGRWKTHDASGGGPTVGKEHRAWTRTASSSPWTRRDAGEAVVRAPSASTGRARWLKVGMTLFYAEGPDIVERLRDDGLRACSST